MEAYTTDEPIYALATAFAPSALSVVRTSGDNCIQMISKIFSSKKRLLEAKSKTLVHGYLQTLDGERIDEVVLSVYRKGQGYTGEEAVEISAHGSLSGLKRIFRALEDVGFRKAKRGEFTFRAFMHGRMDLTQAEAVEEIISSKSELSQAKALDRLEGRLRNRLEEYREKLLYILSSLEVQLDYAEDEIPEEWIFPEEEVDEIITGLERLLSSYDASSLYRDGAKIVLAGSTNAGKSSLFNLLMKENRAIVSSIPGTTRDYIEAWSDIRGIPIRLYDTAGLRESADEVESEGIKRSERLIEEADLILYLVDPIERKLPKEKRENMIILYSKSDIEKGEGLSISSQSGEGIEELFDEIEAFLTKGGRKLDDIVIDSERQRVELASTLETLRTVRALRRDTSVDVYALYFQSALEGIGAITGEVTNEELLDTLFSKFCVGK
ncbi:MAG: tRNA uridine-5-carboxymethylaminomethyl(34) synthesis GTPase MnmE [Sphaerochaetaceae bacterium]|nr:tRNA uridine-5-carboxymethylaminomethyl(34) synthesis GTPase MnmE [Sphaerochaetaceae bacterium]